MTAALIETLRHARQRVVIVFHFNHPREIDDDCRRAARALAGFTLLNQSVLLAGVNDDAGTLAELSEHLFDAGVLPYYLHMPDRVAGTAHFDVPDARALAVHGALAAKLPRLPRTATRARKTWCQGQGAALPITPRTLALCAGLGYLAAVTATLVTWHFHGQERSARAMDRFGSQMADDLAYLAVEPMMRPDRIRLGLLAKRMVERPEVRSVEMYSVDGTELVVEGNPRPDSPTYLSQVAIQNTVAGHVRVMLHPDQYQPATSALLGQSWWLLAGGFVIVVGIAYGYGRLSTRERRTAMAAAPQPDNAEPSRFFLLVATMFPHGDGDADVGANLLHRGLAIAERVANLYAAEAVPWHHTGLAVIFPASTSGDRGFEVVCAGLLLQRLLGARHHGDESLSSQFRLGLDLVTGDWVDDRSAVVETASAEAVAVLASLAPDGALVLGRAAYSAVSNAERIRLQAFDNPAFETLSGQPCPKESSWGTDASHDALIEQQAEMVAVASL